MISARPRSPTVYTVKRRLERIPGVATWCCGWPSSTRIEPWVVVGVCSVGACEATLKLHLEREGSDLYLRLDESVILELRGVCPGAGRDDMSQTRSCVSRCHSCHTFHRARAFGLWSSAPSKCYRVMRGST